MRACQFLANVCVLLCATTVAADDEFFEARVRPLLVDRCFECHQRQAEGGLRLDSRPAMLQGGTSGPAVIPHDPGKSLLIQVVKGEHETIAMPPDDPLTPSEVQILATWIQDGATWSQDATPTRAAPDQHGITDAERAFWSLQPIRRPVPPPIEGEWSRHPIDAFVSGQHRQHGISPTSPSPPPKLLRRLSYDLIGLPPTPDELLNFERRAQDDWQSAVASQIDRLLESRHYGERWGQHWLDLVRYADTAGDAADFPVPEAYKYRDYVIDAFQQDKPYDQFIREQIAGDLLTTEDEDEEAAWQRTVATGYIALSRRVGVVPETHLTIEDTINNLGKTFLGLTIGCARCHDHKFDPIPTSDYYALYGIFRSSIYPHAGAEHQPHRKDFVYRGGQQHVDAAMAPFQESLDRLRREERTALEKYRDLQRKPESELGYTREEAWTELLAKREELRRFAMTTPDLDTAFAISEGDFQDAHIQMQGNPRKRGPQVPRGFLQVLGGQTLADGNDTSGRRQLAEWIASPENPLTARVMANRVWHYHFGRGLVATTSDFGVRGERPSHPELLDYLAGFLIDHDWSIKALHRLILTSRTWQLASQDVPANSELDPTNVYLWRGNRRRLDAEQLRDSLLMISGQLDTSPGGSHAFPHPLTYFYRQHEPFVGNFSSQHRSVYLFRQRIRKNRYLNLFDGPDGNLHLGQRRPTTTSLQSLYLMNSAFMAEQSEAVAKRIASTHATSESRIRGAYEYLFGRSPTTDERHAGSQYLSRLASAQTTDDWTGFVHAMLCSNEFLYID